MKFFFWVVAGGYLGMIKALRVASGGEGTVIKVCLVDPTGEGEFLFFYISQN